MKQLKDIKNIRLTVAVNSRAITGGDDFSNYFRLFKNTSEIVSENSFYSPFFAGGVIVSMSEHYGDRKNAMEAISGLLRRKDYITVYLSYDFSLAAINDEYHTDGEFEFVKRLVEKALDGTGLYLAFMVSHFNQLTGKALSRKPEHYHAILCRENNCNYDYDKAINGFADNLNKYEFVNIKFGD